MSKRLITYTILAIFSFITIGVSIFLWNFYPIEKENISYLHSLPSTESPKEAEPSSDKAGEKTSSSVPLDKLDDTLPFTSPSESFVVRYLPGYGACVFSVFANGVEEDLLTIEIREEIGFVECAPNEAGGVTNPFLGWSEEEKLFIKNEKKAKIYDPLTGNVETFEYKREEEVYLIDVDKTVSYFLYFLPFPDPSYVLLDRFKNELFSSAERGYDKAYYDDVNHGLLLGKNGPTRNTQGELVVSYRYDFLSFEDFSIINILQTREYPYEGGRGCGLPIEDNWPETEVGEFLFFACGSGLPSQVFEGQQYIIVKIPTSS